MTLLRPMCGCRAGVRLMMQSLLLHIVSFSSLIPAAHDCMDLRWEDTDDIGCARILMSSVSWTDWGTWELLPCAGRHHEVPASCNLHMVYDGCCRYLQSEVSECVQVPAAELNHRRLMTGAAPRPCLARLCPAQTENLYDVLRPDRRLSPAVTHDPAVKAACRAGTEGLCRPVLIFAAVKGSVCVCIALRCVPVAGHDGFRNWPATGNAGLPCFQLHVRLRDGVRLKRWPMLQFLYDASRIRSHEAFRRS